MTEWNSFSNQHEFGAIQELKDVPLSQAKQLFPVEVELMDCSRWLVGYVNGVLHKRRII